MLYLVLFLILVNAFFTAAEFALATLQAIPTHRYKEPQGLIPRLVSHQIERIDLYLSSCQLGISGASIALGSAGEPYLARKIGHLIGIAVPDWGEKGITIGLALLVITFTQIVVGEQAPKSLAVRTSEKVAYFAALPLETFTWIFRPLIYLIELASTSLLKIFHITPKKFHFSQEALEFILLQSHLSGSISQEERKIMINAMELADVEAKEVMVPRPDVITLPADATVADAQKMIAETGYSRIPVVDPDLDHCMGIVHAKDLFRSLFPDEPASRYARKPLYVPETISLERLLKHFRFSQTHLALVVDEFGGVRGIVTLEDVLERLVGEIHDEHDLPDPPSLKSLGGRRYRALGMTALADLERVLGLKIDSDQETLNGWLISEFDGFPKSGDSLERLGYRFTVENMDTRYRRIGTVFIEPIASSTS